MAADDKNRGNVQQYTDKQLWLIRYLVAKMGVTEQQVKDAIGIVGDDQKKIEKYLTALQ
jgi:hypothetical protein